MMRLQYHLSSHSMSFQVAILVISTILLAPSIFSSPRNVYAASKSSAQCQLTIQNSVPSLQSIAQRFQIAFNTLCPELVKRFAPQPTVTNNVLLTFTNTCSLACHSGNNLMGNPSWAQRSSKDVVGAFTNQLAMIIQAYPSSTPTWFVTGMADYVRSIYGPADDDWALPPSKEPGDNYTQGFAVTARFLHWLEQETVPTIVDQLNRAMQARQPFPATFQLLAGGTVDQLWSKYEANSVLIPFQRIPTPDDTSSTICKLTVENADSSVRDIVRRYQIAFNAVCPKMAKRFASSPDAVKNVLLTFASSAVTNGNPAFTSGNHITADATWMAENKNQAVGALIHELEHVMQFTSPSWFDVSPPWFTEGMADYVRSIYGPADDDWSMPPVKQTDSYTEAYRVAARFLHWLEQHTKPTIVEQLCHAMQEGQPLLPTFQLLAGDTINNLWSKYESSSSLSPFQRIPAPDN